jgi:hypothetical protein
VHSSFGLAPFELVLSRPPPPLSVESSETVSENTPENARLHFLHRLKELQPLSQRRLVESQARYKASFYRSVREKNKELQPGSWVYLRREVHDAGVSQKLDDHVDGTFGFSKPRGEQFCSSKEKSAYVSRLIELRRRPLRWENRRYVRPHRRRR